MKVSTQCMAPHGPEVSELAAGFWRLKHWGMTPQALVDYLEQLLEFGITTMDHAMVYRSEAPFGQALALRPDLRERMQIVTKCGIHPVGHGEFGAKATNHYDSSNRSILRSVEATLANLQTEYVDLLLLHRPDYLMDVHEVAEAFSQLKASGKVRHFGVSNFNVHQFELLQSVWQEGLVTNQIELSPGALGHLESGVLEQCQRYGLRPMAWSCLGGGRLSNPVDDQSRRVNDALEWVAGEVGAHSLEHVIYAWVRALPSRPVLILGTSKIERVRVAVESLDIRLSREQWYTIWQAANGAPVP